jgi:two-component sensor histidine kinase
LEYMAEKIAEREHQLHESVAQKQIMIREIHHRVKNNLQIVTSLLNVYARKPSSDATKQAFSDIQVRINTLALVHRHLYESQDLQAINLAPFMTNLCNLLYDGCGVSSRRVRMLVDIPNARVNGDRAVPLALLTTELLTNSFKHAFPDNRSGVIRVKMRLDNAGDACLVIADDGVGNSSTISSDGRFRMGQFLIDALTKQLGGWIEKSGPISIRTWPFPRPRRRRLMTI